MLFNRNSKLERQFNQRTFRHNIIAECLRHMKKKENHFGLAGETASDVQSTMLIIKYLNIF